MRKAIFPNGLKLSQLEDVDFPEHHAANAKPVAVAVILTQSFSLRMIHRLAQILGRMPLMGSEDLQNLLKCACTLCSTTLL